MILATNELKLQRRVGLWGPAICLVLALIAIALLASNAMGQQPADIDVVGHVVDAESGQALVGAFVSLTGSEWGSITDETGRFRIPDLDAGRHSLTVEQLGYETLVWEGEVAAGEALRLALAPQPIMLEGLRVVTDRFRSRRNRSAVNVRVYDRAELATSPQSTALEFLRFRVGSARERCPTAFGGDLCLRVRGRTVSPVVYVDEVPMLGGLDYLDALAPHELHMVEIFAQGRHIRAYTTLFMERAARTRLQPVAIF